ncbi:MAG: hypothetical protein ACI4RI_06720 [Ruminococcus sp.]
MGKEPYVAPTISIDDFGSSDVITASVPEEPKFTTERDNVYFSFFDL